MIGPITTRPVFVVISIMGVACLIWPRPVAGHARLWTPPGRSTMWRRGFDTPRNYDDNQLFCGGFAYQRSQGYRCGVCGDPYGKPSPNEAGGIYATGTIAKTYTQGQQAVFEVDVTANHKGYFEFRLCPVNNPKTDVVTQKCLDQTVLQVVGASGTRYQLGTDLVQVFDITVQLPHDLSCESCVLQFKYHTGNSWGTDPDGTSCLGCGPQEEFYACADIRINGDGSSSGSGNGGNVTPPVQTTQKTTQQTTTRPTTTRLTTTMPTTRRESIPTRTTANPSPNSGAGTTNNNNQGGSESNNNQGGSESNNNQGGSESNNNQGGSTNSGGQPTNQNGGIEGDKLVCTAKVAGPGMNEWCQLNCQMGNCPPLYCECRNKQYPHEQERPEGCRAAGVYATVPGMDKWCADNCPPAVHSNCPSSMCTCS